MSGEVDLVMILLAGFVASASPGPATLAIAGTSMARGRAAGLMLAAGITTGSLCWSVSAALGLGAMMLANAWVFETIRICGALYLLFLALKSARAALSSRAPHVRTVAGTLPRLYGKGLALHLTNPKPILFFGALYAVGVPADATPAALATVILAVGAQSLLVFHLYALVFSLPPVSRAYMRMRRGFEAGFAAAFGAAGLRILTARAG